MAERHAGTAPARKSGIRARGRRVTASRDAAGTRVALRRVMSRRGRGSNKLAIFRPGDHAVAIGCAKAACRPGSIPREPHDLISSVSRRGQPWGQQPLFRNRNYSAPRRPGMQFVPVDILFRREASQNQNLHKLGERWLWSCVKNNLLVSARRSLKDGLRRRGKRAPAGRFPVPGAGSRDCCGASGGALPFNPGR